MTEKKHTAGALDIRSVIGALLLLYGLILLITRLVAGDEGGANSEGVNANLWAGIGLVVVGGAFLLWSRVRPTVVPDRTESEVGPDADGH